MEEIKMKTIKNFFKTIIKMVSTMLITTIVLGGVCGLVAIHYNIIKFEKKGEQHVTEVFVDGELTSSNTSFELKGYRVSINLNEVFEGNF